MKYCLKILCTLLAVVSYSFCTSQNIGINNNTPQATLDVYGDVIFRSADLVVADGITLALDVNNNRFSYYRISGPTAAFTLAGITQGVDGRLVTLFNRSGYSMQLNNQDATSAATERIITGTNASLIIDNFGIVNMQYDGLEQKWVVLSHNKTTGAAISGGWGLTGNSGNSTLNFIGNTDAVPLLLKTNNTDVANFNGNNVSLGVNAGAGFGSGGNNYFLGGQMRSPLTSANYSVAIGTNAEISGDEQIIIGAPFHKTGIGLGYDEAPDHTLNIGKRYNNVGALKIRGAVYSSHFNYANTEDTYIRGGKLLSKVFINEGNGGDILLGEYTTSKVGIGTSTPEYKLHIRSPNENVVKIDGQNSLVLFHDRNTNAQYGFFRAWTDNPFNPANKYGLEIGTPPRVGTDPAKHLLFSTNYNIRMVITEDGAIGIGTANPDAAYLLNVNGKIKTKEIRVTTANWADYVFDKDYKLMPLKEVEIFINNNKHLPNVSAASEIEKNGLDLSSMQSKMMEKIEELTLYLIEANKKIENLERKLDKK
jgi:hypothetical protein